MSGKNDVKYMNIALKLAKRGAGKVFPNPMVGAVIVKNGKIAAKGWHERFGGPHAEINALRSAGPRAKGATLYVTLEPCAHWGKTPPCADMIIKAGIARVVAAAGDPNPRTAGLGFKKLTRNGVKVVKNIQHGKAISQNKAYFARFPLKRSHVTVKAAMTLDGKIASRCGDSKWISSTRSRRMVHRLRSRQDAVLVGINTVLADDPALTSHGNGKNPVRVIIDPDLRIPLSSAVLDRRAPAVIFTKSKLKVKLEALKNRGAIVSTYFKPGDIDFKYIIKELANMSIYRVLIEGGGETIASALKAGVVNDFMLFISPKIIGGRDAKTPVEGQGTALMSRARRLSGISVKRIGPDILIKGRMS